MVNYTRKAARGVGIVFVMMVASYFLGYVFRLLIKWSLGISTYGLIYGVIAFFGLFSIFMDLGLKSTLVKYTAEFKARRELEKIKGAFIMILSIKLLFSALVCGTIILFSDAIATGQFKTPAASPLIKIYGLGVIFSSIGVTLRSSFQGFQAMKYFSSVDFVKSVLVLVITAALLLMGLHEEAPILGFAVVFTVFLPLIYFPLFVKKVFPEFLRTRADLSRTLAKRLLKFGVMTSTVGLAGTIMGYTDTVLLTYFRTLEEVGVYNAALPTTMTLIGVIATAAISIVFPMSSELWAAGKKEHLRKGIETLYKYTVIAVFPIALMIFLYPEFLVVLFGREVQGAGNVLKILSVGYFIETIIVINNTVLSGIGKPKETSKITAVGAGINLALNVLLIPSYGMEGAAFSTLVAFIVIYALSERKIREYITFTVPWKAFVVVGISGILIAVASYSLRSAGSLGLLESMTASGLVGGLIYAGLLYFSGTITVEELKNVAKKVA